MFKQAIKPASAEHKASQPMSSPAAPQQRAPVASTWTRALSALPLQAKLTVNQPGDVYEQEADRVVDQVMRMPDPTASTARPCACGGVAGSDGECAACQAKRLSVQRKGATAGGSDAPASVHQTLRAPGQALDSATRAFMEPRFGHDFRHVRVHTDRAAAESAHTINAHAYTVGQHIVFADGRYAQGTDAGKRLIAHELAHTIQQRGSAGSVLQRVPERDGIPERYIFSSNCGWIDWGHADPGLVTTLITRVRAASDTLRAAGANPPAAAGDLATPTMSSGVPRTGVILSSASLSARLLRPLSPDEVSAVALSLFKKLSLVFETQQEWTDLIGRSSFAQEDLPSNLIGFYRAVYGYSRADIGRFCGELSADASRDEYNRNHDFRRNRSFTPIGATGPWPPELSTIDDNRGAALYEIRSIAARQGSDAFQFCPMYRIEGTIGETDLFLFSVGGTRFTAADNVRVVPTYRFRQEVHGAYGHTTVVEVEPHGQADWDAFARNKLTSPMFVPQNVLVCLSSRGNPVP